MNIKKKSGMKRFLKRYLRRNKRRDTDTIACMTGSISEAYYGIPKYLRNKALTLIPDDLREIVIEAYTLIREKALKLQEEYEV